MEKIALIVEGGGMRGMYAAGILDSLIQHNLYWGNVYGVSAGACHALSYLSRQFDRARRVNINYVQHLRYSGLYCLIRHGTFFGFDYIFKTIPAREQIDWYTYFHNQSNMRRFYITVTNARTGLAEYKSPENPQDAIDWLRASSSLPIIGKPVLKDGETWFDGGIADSIPVRKAIADGHTRLVIILTQPEGYRKKAISSTTEKILRKMYKKYPVLIDANLKRADTYNNSLDHIEQMEANGTAFVFRPAKSIITDRLCKNRKKLQRLYDAGYEDAENHLMKLRSFAPSGGAYCGH